MNATIALDRDGDHAWTIARSIGILSMQGGFALLEAGCVRPANCANIMMKNIADMSFGMVFFLIIGYSLCFAGTSCNLGVADVSGKGCRTGALSRPDELSAVASTPAMAAAPAAASPAEAV